MAATQRLELRQAQSLVMTPQLQQAIKLLQLSNLELCAFVEQEIDQNPLLERDTGEEPGDPDPSAESGQDDDRDTGGNEPDTWDQVQEEGAGLADDGPLDASYENVFDPEAGGPLESMGGAQGGAAVGGDSDDFNLDQRIGEDPTLRQHLVDQLPLEIQDPGERIIGLHLIDSLDEAGYLPNELDFLADQLECSLEQVEQVLVRLQRFEPSGLFARSLRECLALQLADLNRLDPAMEALLDHLQLVAKGDRAALKDVCGVDEEDLTDMIRELRRLDPKPGQTFDARPAEPIVPDIFMRATASGTWRVELNSDTLPKVLFDNHYYEEVLAKTRTKAERSYLNEQYQTANWLVKALHQRATTILKVASEIVRQQDGFFRKGIRELKPLTLRDIAEAIEMHESTVSRVTSNKYMMTPRGIYELKYFFSAALAGANGESHSAESIRHRIKGLIDSEPPDKVLSDDSIVAILRGRGVELARRTVAKYREAMKISSSVQRRRAKASPV